ncbi:sugar phosphate isomerase/epimerase family protein [Cupriavidus basilensis]|uniref:sugar phosphate isomerase/epimerase family protein n=1 Tax=Cupriavidus basilensis TaxID=68895 RepID=UPI0020A6B67C|nr:sugar phosphate isomerase/epimerase [Cupriavidus basilensis]MCP3022922.1 sugar phosphate isomerase/epimerase [Cupriavidus basilensis]
MSHSYSLAYLTSNTLTPAQAIQLAAELGYRFVGLRLVPNAAGAPQQALIGRPDMLRETLAVQRDTGVGVFDLEIIRIGEDFDPRASLPLLETGAALKAKAVLVAGDDADPARLADSYARLCELMLPYGMTADLEFMPWTAVPDARTALGIVDAAGRPANAGILADALHVARSGTTFDDLRALPRELLHYAQICDAPASAHLGRAFTVEEMIHTARCERLLPGEGGIDLKGLFAALPADLPVSVEVPHDIRLPQVGQTGWARQALAASRAVLEPGASSTQ